MTEIPVLASPEWPPSSLGQLDLKYCQAREVAAGIPDLDLYVVHMAGLLYHQDWMAARHLLRRSGEMDELKPWYEVAKAALKPDLEAVWKSLEKLHSNTAVSHPFIQTYVNEISHAFRVACLSQFDHTKNIPAYLASVVGFSTVEEMSNFAREYLVPARSNISHVVAAGFLHSRLTADISALPTTSGNNDEVASGAVAASSS